MLLARSTRGPGHRKPLPRVSHHLSRHSPIHHEAPPAAMQRKYRRSAVIVRPRPGSGCSRRRPPARSSRSRPGWRGPTAHRSAPSARTTGPRARQPPDSGAAPEPIRPGSREPEPPQTATGTSNGCSSAWSGSHRTSSSSAAAPSCRGPTRAARPARLDPRRLARPHAPPRRSRSLGQPAPALAPASPDQQLLPRGLRRPPLPPPHPQ